MIDKIKLENFKCFRDTEINVNMLNIYSGINGMGKSTTIQALLLLKQSIQQGYAPGHITLNGDYVNIGTGFDLLHENAENDHIKITLFHDTAAHSVGIVYDGKSDILALDEYDNEVTELLSVPFEYLNAERSSPQSIYPKSSYHVDSMSQLGIHGQYTVHYLSKYQDNGIPWNSCDGKEKSLKGAVQYWLNEISPNVKLNAYEIEHTDLTQLQYYYTDTDSERSNTFRPTNVGFGISYILPVIVALIKATPGSIIIIENPEAHLHPRGQRKMGELLAKCASCGIQIFVETHSDHVLNGIRIAVKKKVIKHTDVNLVFFTKKEKDNEIIHTIEIPKINENGKLDYWPDGFFDEWDKALDEII